MQAPKVHCVKLSDSAGELVRVGEIDVILPKKPGSRKIHGSHRVKRNQKWERFELPEDFDWYGEEDQYSEEELEFIKEDFDRRINGTWIMVKGKPVWITGTHYYYLQWCKIDVGYPDYRDRDRRFFYFWEACVKDDDCYGMQMVKHRREGATYKGAAIILEIITRSFRATGGIMSKTGPDAKEFFHKLVKMFRSLPKFYQPIIAGTDNPKTMLEFDKPGERITKKSKRVKRSEALESKIEWKNTAENSFDSYKLKIFVPDEGGKWDEVDVRQNWRVVKPTLTQGRNIIGKAFFPSTVNEMSKKGGSNYKEMWDESDPNDRDLNNQTKTGLYRYMTPAYDGLEGFIDEYGDSVIETPKKPVKGIDGRMIKFGAKDYLDNKRRALKHNPEALAEEKRQFPYNPEEAFMVATNDCAFNVEFLYSQYDWNAENAGKLITQGDFVWKNEFGGDVEFIPSRVGRWKVVWLPDKKERNLRIYRNGMMYPGNMDTIVSGNDPYDHDTTVSGVRSNAASYVFRMANPIYPRESNMFVSEYIARPPTAYIMYEDMLKQSIFYGCQILTEDNKPGLINWFTSKGYRQYLMNRPEITQTKTGRNRNAPGVPTSGDGVRDTLLSVTESYIYHNVGWFEEKNELGLVYFNHLIEDWLKFEVDKWTKYDATVAAGLALLASKKNIKKPVAQDNGLELTRRFKVHGTKSVLIQNQ
jgi:hypothetical protein